MKSQTARRFNETLTHEDELQHRRFDLTDISDNGIEYDEVPFQTQPAVNYFRLPVHAHENEDKEKLDKSPKDSVTLSEIEGVVVDIESEIVRVKLLPHSYFNFPKVLFSEPVKLGQHIKYLIKKDIEGYRYQEIVPFYTGKSHPEKELILKLLDEIKPHNE